MPSVTGEVLEKIGPYLTLADRMGCLQAQLVRGPIKEVVVEFHGDFKDRKKWNENPRKLIFEGTRIVRRIDREN